MAIYKGKIRQRNSGGTYDYLLPETTIDMVNGLQDELDSFEDKIEQIEMKEINLLYPPSPLVPPVADGVTDDSMAINAISQFAKSNNLPIFVPYSKYLIEDTVDFYTSLRSEGIFIVNSNQTNEGISFKRTLPQVIIEPSTLGNLTKDTLKISELSNMTGYTICFVSNETYMNRNDPSGGTYVKRETFKVLDALGTISIPLMFTYTDMSKLTVIAFPPEKPITVEGLNIIIKSNGNGGVIPLVLDRSDIVVKSIKIENENENLSTRIGVRILRACDINFYDSKISNLKNTGDNTGYGISLTEVAHVRLSNCDITNCRHAVSGRWASDVSINGGTYSRIDSHWGNSFSVSNLKIIIEQDEYSAISFSGKDLMVSNVEATGLNLRFLVSIRNDTPELDGKLIIDNSKIKTMSDWVRLVGYNTASTTFDFGKSIINPKLIRIKNITIDAPISTPIVVLQAGTSAQRRYNQTTWGKIEIGDIELVNDNPLNIIYIGVSEELYEPLQKTMIKIKNINQKFESTTNHSTVKLYDHSTSPISNELKMDLYVENCKGFKAEVNPSSTSNILINNTIVRNFNKGSLGNAGDLINSNLVTFDNCTLLNTDNRNGKSNCYLNCKFDGAITLVSSQTKLTKGNYAMLGSTGYPQLDGVLDSSIFITS